MPIRGGFQNQSKQAARLSLGVDGRPLILSYWGSLGAQKMNEIITDFIALNLESRMFNHIHATGGGEAISKALKERLYEKTGAELIPRWIDIRDVY